MIAKQLQVPEAPLRRFCEQHRIRSLAFFGSVLREDFTPASDVDVLVGFFPGQPLGLIRLGSIEAELSDLIGRRVDLNLPELLSPYFRDEVLAEAETVYDAA